MRSFPRRCLRISAVSACHWSGWIVLSAWSSTRYCSTACVRSRMTTPGQASSPTLYGLPHLDGLATDTAPAGLRHPRVRFCWTLRGLSERWGIVRPSETCLPTPRVAGGSAHRTGDCGPEPTICGLLVLLRRGLGLLAFELGHLPDEIHRNLRRQPFRTVVPLELPDLHPPGDDEPDTFAGEHFSPPFGFPPPQGAPPERYV